MISPGSPEAVAKSTETGAASIACSAYSAAGVFLLLGLGEVGSPAVRIELLSEPFSDDLLDALFSDLAKARKERA